MTGTDVPPLLGKHEPDVAIPTDRQRQAQLQFSQSNFVEPFHAHPQCAGVMLVP